MRWRRLPNAFWRLPHVRGCIRWRHPINEDSDIKLYKIFWIKICINTDEHYNSIFKLSDFISVSWNNETGTYNLEKQTTTKFPLFYRQKFYIYSLDKIQYVLRSRNYTYLEPLSTTSHRLPQTINSPLRLGRVSSVKSINDKLLAGFISLLFLAVF